MPENLNTPKQLHSEFSSMIKPLPLTVELHEHEPATSFISRLAARHGALSVRDFTSDIGFPYAALISGESKAIEHLSLLGACAPAKLAAFSIKNKGRNAFRLRNEIATTHTILRSHIRICTNCILEDTIGPDEAWHAWQRIHWQFVPIRSCNLHNCALMKLPKEPLWINGYDFAGQISQTLEYS